MRASARLAGLCSSGSGRNVNSSIEHRNQARDIVEGVKDRTWIR